MQKSVLVPPMGFVGFSQSSQATRNEFGRAAGSRSSAAPRSRRRSKSASKKRVSRRTGKKRSGNKLKFGSPAWQKKYKVGKYKK